MYATHFVALRDRLETAGERRIFEIRLITF